MSKPMKQHCFFLPMKSPPTATHQTQAVRVVKGKPVFYDPPALADARQKLTALLWPHRPDKPLTGPVQLCVAWCFPLDKGKRHHDGEYKTTKPDTDNLQKLLKDCMTKVGFWKDDAQVCEEFVQKFWAEHTGVRIFVGTLAAQDEQDGAAGDQTGKEESAD